MGKNLLIVCAVFISLVLVVTAKEGTAADLPKEIILGIPTDTGGLAGRDSYRAALLAVEEVNQKGGVKIGNTMLPFRVETANTRDSSPGVPVTEALLAVEKLILEKKINFIVVGSYRTEAILAQMDLVSKYRIPMLASIAAAPQYTMRIANDPKYKYCFRVGCDAQGMVKGILTTLSILNKKFGFDTVYFIAQDVAWAKATTDMVSKIIEQKGMKVLGYDRFPTGASQFASSLTRVKETGAKIIMSTMEMPEGAIMVKQVNSMKIPAIVCGVIGEVSGQKAWETYQGKIADVIILFLEMADLPAKKWPRALAFHVAYEKRWGDKIDTSHGPAPAYESVYMLKRAIEKVGSLDPDAVVRELEETDYVGLLGRIHFDKKNHQLIYGFDIENSAAMAIVQWSEKGERVVVFPEDLAEGQIVLPPSLR
jgi:branched-chain amino acid transport system substrate-binding protein